MTTSSASPSFPTSRWEADWPTATGSAEVRSRCGLDLARLDVMARFQSYLHGGLSSQLLVIRHGVIAAEHLDRNARVGTAPHVHSVTKSVVSLGIGHLLASGTVTGIDLDTRVADVLPGRLVGDARKSAITIRHLLSMTAGLPGESAGVIGTYAATAAGGEFEYVLGSAPGRDGAGLAELAAPPGSRWDYSCASYLLLSMVCVALSMPIDRYLAPIFGAIGLTDWYWEQAGGRGRQGPLPATHIGLHLPARELARLGYCLLHQGRWDDRQVLPAEYLQEATTPGELNSEYGLGFWLNRHSENPALPTDLVAMKGYHGNRCYVVESEDLVVVRTGQGPAILDDSQLLAAVLAAVVD